MANAYGLYSHIRSNWMRSIFLLLGLFLLIYILVYAIALVVEAYLHSSSSLEVIMWRAKADFIFALPFATVAAMLWIIIAYFFHQNMIDAVTGGELVTRTDQPRLYNLLENMCISRGIPMPKLKVMDTPALNAFATGLNQAQYSITLTTGLLKNLNDTEMEAVLGHELTHIRNGDVQLMVIAMIIAGVVSFLGEMIFRMFTGNGSGRSGSRWSSSSSSSSSSNRKSGGGAIIAVLIAIALIMIAWLLSQVVKMALSRSREYLADAGSVELTKNPDAMITALRKIEGRGELPGSTSSVMEMCIDNPRSGFTDLFSTHPSVDSRVDKLVHFAGGHDPGPIVLAKDDEEDGDGEEEPKVKESKLDTISDEPLNRNPWEDKAQPTRGPWGGRDA